MKTVTILLAISRVPDWKTAEMLRMGVGLTLADENRIRVLFIDDGVYAASGFQSESAWSAKDIEKHIETLGALGANLFADEKSANQRGVVLDKFGIKAIDPDHAAGLMDDSDITII